MVTTMASNRREAEDTSQMAHQDEGFHSQVFRPASQSTETQVSTMPIFNIQDFAPRDLAVKEPLLPSSPNRQAKSPTRSSTARSRRFHKPSKPFILKKRVIPQSDGEEAGDEANAEPQETEQANLNEDASRNSLDTSPMDRFALAFQKVEAWRSGNAAVAQMSIATSSEQALASSQTQGVLIQQDNESNSLAMTTFPPSAGPATGTDVERSKKRSAQPASKAKKKKASFATKGRKI